MAAPQPTTQPAPFSDNDPPEGQPRAGHESFYGLIRNNPFGVYVVDADFKLREISRGSQKVFQHVRPLIGRDFAEILRAIWVEPFASEAIARFRHTLDTGEPFSSPRTVERRQDIAEVEAYDWRIERITLPDGRFGVVCYFYDLSERQRWEAALAASEARYRSLFDSIDQGFCIVKVLFDGNREPTDYRFVAANPAFERHTGLVGAVGRTARELLPDLEPGWVEVYGRVALTGAPERFEQASEAMGRWFDVYAFRVDAPQDRHVAILFTDVTRRRRDEEALRHSEERLRAVFQQTEAGIAQVNLDGRFVLANDRYCQIVGRPCEELLNLRMQDITHPDDLPRNLQLLSEALGSGKPFDIEKRYVRPDGSAVWVSNSVSVMRDRSGRPSGVLAASVDVTDRRRAEEALRESDAHARRIIDNTLAFVGVMTPDGTLTEANATALRAGGLRREDVVGRKFWDCYWWSYDAGVQARLRDAVARAAQGEVVRYDETVRMDGDARMPIDFMLSPVADAEGRVTHLIPSGTDITDRKRAEEELRAQSVVTETVTNNAAEALYLLDADGCTTYANPAAEAMFGWSRQEMLGKKLHDLIHYKHPDGRAFPMSDCTVGQCFASGRTLRNHEDLFVHRDGSFVPVLCSMAPIRRDGRPAGAVLAVADITDRKRAEEAVRRAKEEAERASEAKSEFLATLSHELRTPLTPVLLTVSLMESHPDLPEDLREDVATIRRNVELESRLISDLLDLTRIAKGKMQLEERDVDLHLVVRSAVNICQREASARVNVDLAAARHTVRGDATRLQQIFWNLINNAMKFTPQDGTVTVRSSDAGGGRVRVDVIDTGVGINPEVLPRLFNAFEQGEVRAARQQAGLGLGLAISKRLAEAHGGTIIVASGGPGRGATFTVELPAVEQVEAAPAPEPSAEEPAAGRPLRVLLVEDHEPSLRVLEKLLRRLGHRVTGVTSAASAVAAAGHDGFDLIISDLGLPDGSGLDVMRRLRDQYEGRAIALTGYGMESDVAASRDAGFAQHLTKPVDFAALKTAIREVTAASS